MSSRIFSRAVRRASGVVLMLGVMVLTGQKVVAQVQPQMSKIPVKVVVVSMFERGQISGDEPGEFQFWVERLPLDKQLDFPLGPYPLRMNDNGVLGVCLGGGIANAAATMMALGLDPRFDLSQSYWLIAGIAGGDPQDSTLGSAVWAEHIVDGDLLYEIDGREIPSDWPYGMIPLGGEHPAETPEDQELHTRDRGHEDQGAGVAEPLGTLAARGLVPPEGEQTVAPIGARGKLHLEPPSSAGAHRSPDGVGESVPRPPAVSHTCRRAQAGVRAPPRCDSLPTRTPTRGAGAPESPGAFDCLVRRRPSPPRAGRGPRSSWERRARTC